MNEVLIYGSNCGKSGPAAPERVISAVDLHSGSSVSTFKATTSPSHGIACTKDHLFSVQYNSAQLNVYVYGRESVLQKIVLPEKLSCIAVSPKGTYLAGGSPKGRMLIWELASGNLLFAQDCHYQGITCLAFTQDEGFVFSGGDDSRVLGWQMAELVSMSGSFEDNEFDDGTVDEDGQIMRQSIRPAISWTDHSLPISDLHVGYGSSLECRVYTASKDKTVRIWDLRTGQLLSTFVLSRKITSLAVDPAERAVYAGFEDGGIRIINLYSLNSSTGFLESVGGAKRIITLEDDSKNVLDQHTAEVTSLALSFDGTKLVSGDSSGSVLVWDIISKLVVAVPKRHSHPISSIHVLTRLGDDKPSENKLPVFKRNLGEGRKEHKLLVQIQPPAADTLVDKQGDILDKLDAQAKALSGTAGNDLGLQTKVESLEGSLERLQDDYNQLRALHQELWKRHVQANT